VFYRFRPAYYLNNAQALRSALTGAGVAEDVAAIAAADALTYDKLWRPERLAVGLIITAVGWIGVLFVISAYAVAAFFGSWLAIAAVGLCVAISVPGIHLLMSRYVKEYRASRFARIALGRSHMIAGPSNCAALDSAEGLSGEDYIEAVLRRSRSFVPAFLVGLVFALALFLMSSPGHALTHR
jgi:hypothetical protein